MDAEEEKCTFPIPKCEKCDFYMSWVAYNAALHDGTPPKDHWICSICSETKEMEENET